MSLVDIDLLHGDCREIIPNLPRKSMNCLITDPPFGFKSPSNRRQIKGVFAEIAGNDKVETEWLAECWKVMADDSSLYLFTCWEVLSKWKMAVKKCGWRIRSLIVWDKMIHGSGDLERSWAPQHELILFATKGEHRLCGKRLPNIIRAQRMDPDKTVHPYQKPTKLMVPLIRSSTNKGQRVFDPFSGVGTVALACCHQFRCCTSIEIDPNYHRLAQKLLKKQQGGLGVR